VDGIAPCADKQRLRVNSAYFGRDAGVVTVEWLAALDALIWLRTGDRAAELLGCTQSTVSRSSRRCLKAFELTMHRRKASGISKGT